MHFHLSLDPIICDDEKTKTWNGYATVLDAGGAQVAYFATDNERNARLFRAKEAG